MFQLNVVHLATRKILIFNNLYTMHDKFEKKWWQDVSNFTTRDSLIDWLFPYDESRLCYSYRNLRMFTNKTLVNDAEAYFFAIEWGPKYNNIESKRIVSKFLI